jgi:7 transmembrane helices usually fused to an inactive transglutaminase/Inactive transglutaminase fused to 7 transmembrane helices
VRNRQLWLLSLTCALTGLGIFYYKAAVLGLPLLPRQRTSVWTVEARLRFVADGGPARVSLRIPDSPPAYQIIDESFVSAGYGLTSEGGEGQRAALWAKRRAHGEQTLYYRVVIHPGSVSAMPRAPRFPSPPEDDAPFHAAAEALRDEVRRQSADIPTFASMLVSRLANPHPDENVRAILAGAASREQLAIHLLAGARIPAREIRGLRLRDRAREIPLESWLAVHDESEWVFLDPNTGAIGLPQDFFVWSWGDGPLIQIEGGSKPHVDFSVLRNRYGSIEVARARAAALGSPLPWLSFLDLPVTTQAVYQVLVLIPLGGLLVVVLRNVVGLATFGTFMPILVALAFRETQLLGGLLMFSFIVATGLLVRRALEQMKLLLVPRIAVMLTVVIFILSISSLAAYGAGLERVLSVALFPIVILTMLIERMSVVWEESGPRAALQQAAGSLTVASLAYLIFHVELIQHLTFVFPELLLVVIAVMLLLGRYSGYRLTELYRFRGLAGGDGEPS